MPKLISDGDEVDARLKEGDRAGVTQQMRPNFIRKAWIRPVQCRRMTTNYVIHAVTRKRLAAGVSKDRLVSISMGGSRLGLDGGKRFRPEGTNPLLSSFPVQLDRRSWQQVFVKKRGNFAYSGAGVVKEE